MSGRPSDPILVASLIESARCLGVAQAKYDQPAIDYWNAQVEEYRLAALAPVTAAGDDDTAQVAVLRSMLKQNEDVQRTFPEGNWWSEECAALRSAISALEAVAPTSDDVWQCVDRLIGGAYAAGINNVAFDMLAAREALVAALTPSREQGEG